MINEIKKRWRAKSVWLGTAAFLFIVLQQFGVNITPEQYDSVVDVILGLLTLWGIIDGSE